MSDIYYHPEKHGLEMLTSHDFSDGCYQFDLRVIWVNKITGELLTARDSGCSCPSPFEGIGKVSELDGFSESMLIEEANEMGRSSHYDGGDLVEWKQEIREIARKQDKGEYAPRTLSSKEGMDQLLKLLEAEGFGDNEIVKWVKEVTGRE